MIDGATGALSVVTDLIDAYGTLPSLFTLGAGAASLKNVGKPKLFGFKKSKYADSCMCSLEYQSFLTAVREHIIIHGCKRRDNMRGNSYTDCHSPISINVWGVTEQSLEWSAGIATLFCRSPHCSDNSWS